MSSRSRVITVVLVHGSKDMAIEWCYSVRERVFLLVNPRSSSGSLNENREGIESPKGHRRDSLPDAVPLPHTRVPVIICVHCQPTPRRHAETPTETALLVTVALAARPRALALRTVRVRVVLVPDLVEEVDLLLALEQRGRDAVHRCVAPALSTVRQSESP